MRITWRHVRRTTCPDSRRKDNQRTGSRRSCPHGAIPYRRPGQNEEVPLPFRERSSALYSPANTRPTFSPPPFGRKLLHSRHP